MEWSPISWFGGKYFVAVVVAVVVVTAVEVGWWLVYLFIEDSIEYCGEGDTGAVIEWVGVVSIDEVDSTCDDDTRRAHELFLEKAEK